MLHYDLLHPDILAALAGAGHGAQILITDGNYPLSTGANPAARLVYLNLSPGLVSATDTLRAIVGATPVEAAHVMRPAEGDEPPIFAEFRALVPGVALQGVGRYEFYSLSRSVDVALAIATGDQQLYANILLTIGVRQPQS